ncbi:MAG TPA: DUF4404 family protein [Pirellulales bacterium]|jgi:hypothetical protein|nr:DUF4404 family protein [Pirellulales bacterium]
MPTDRERLNATLNELLAELSEVDQLDSEVDKRLRGALAEIQTVLDKKQQPAASRASSSGLIDRLGDTARRLEPSHPALSSAIGNLAGMLGQMGF